MAKNNLKKSILKASLSTGRPKGEPKRQVRLLWPVKVADWIERNRDWIIEKAREVRNDKDCI